MKHSKSNSKTIRLTVSCFFLLFFTVSNGQINLDISGNTIFGNQETVAKGISIIDENTSANPAPFKLIRAANNDVLFKRNGFGAISIDSYGKVTMSDNGVSLSSDSPLTVYSSGSSQALDIYQALSGTYGLRIWYTGTSTVPIAIHKDGSLVFDVDGSGNTHASGYYYTSDISFKSDMERISDPLEKVMQLRGVVYKMSVPQGGKSTEPEETLAMARKRVPGMSEDTFNQIREERSRRRMGVVAQEVEKIVPEVVRTREDGLKSVAYSELVGLLIEAFKEQQSLIDALSLKVATLEGSQLRSAQLVGSVTGISATDNILAKCVLSQNLPNPFFSHTEIEYYLPEGIVDASISIFDMQGKLLDSYPAQVGKNRVTIEGSRLQAGMYLYSLVADGQVADTKKMLLTK